MISKAKILFYGMFGRPKTLPGTKVRKLNFLDKVMLLQVRRFKKYREIPTTLSIFEWNESKSRARKHYVIIGYCILVYILFDIANFFKISRRIRAEQLNRERQENNLPDFPRYIPGGDNPEFDQYDGATVFKEIEAHRNKFRDVTSKS